MCVFSRADGQTLFYGLNLPQKRRKSKKVCALVVVFTASDGEFAQRETRMTVMGGGGTLVPSYPLIQKCLKAASSQACCQRAKENTGGDGGEVGRCETDQTMDVRNMLLVEAKRKGVGGGV